MEDKTHLGEDKFGRSEDDVDSGAQHSSTGQTTEQRLRRLAYELTRTREVERQKIAAELHDNIGQSLALMKMKLLVLRGDAIFSGFDKNLESVLTMLDQTIQSTRSLSFEIHPPILHELGLIETLRWLAERYKTSHNVRIDVFELTRVGMLSQELAGLLFTCTRELVMNSIKYSGEDYMKIEAGLETSLLSIRVIDQGCGFFADKVLDSTYGELGFGLFSIRERINLIGGQFSITSSPGNGTVAEIQVPLTKESSGGTDSVSGG